MNSIHNLYIRFMVWLGAAPPAGYEHLFPFQEIATNQALSITSNVTKEAPSTNLRKAIQIWGATLRNPSLQTWQEIKSEANFKVVWKWMLYVGVISGIIRIVLSFLIAVLSTYTQVSLGPRLSVPYIIFILFASLISMVIVAAVLYGFSNIMGNLFHRRAEARGGKGQSEEQIFLMAALVAPFYLLLRTLGIIPVIGTPLLLIFLFSQISSIARSTQVIYELNIEQAQEVVQTPIVVIIVLYSGYYLFNLYSLYHLLFVMK